MKTTYSIYRPGIAEPERGEIEWPEDPGYQRIKALVEPLLGDKERLEHVTVLHNDGPADMFVSEMGHMVLTYRVPLPINDAATAIYRAAWMRRHPGDDPHDLPTIAGVAVLFDRRVWF